MRITPVWVRSTEVSNLPDADFRKLLEWRRADVMTKRNKGDSKMSQRQWTIEARTDCDDKFKETVSAMVRAYARRLQLVLDMLPEKTSVDVACWSNDFFSGHEDLSLLDDKIGEAEKMLPEGNEPPSEELLDALRNL